MSEQELDKDKKTPHLAVTHKLQGYSANGRPDALLLKAKDGVVEDSEVIKALTQVKVELSMEEFLQRFFGMYWDDAELLTKLLGFETEYEYNKKVNAGQDAHVDVESWLNTKLDRFELMKSAFENNDFSDFDVTDYYEVTLLQKQFEESLKEYEIQKGSSLEGNQGISEGEAEEEDDGVEKAKHSSDKKGVSDKPSKRKVNKNKGELSVTDVNVETLLKSTEVQDLLKNMVAESTKEMQELVKAQETQIAELKKAAEAYEILKAEREARIKEGFTNLVKSFSYVDESAQESLAEVLYKSAGMEGFSVVVDALEKAQAKVEEVKKQFMQQDDGYTAPADIDTVEKSKEEDLAERIEKAYAGKSFLQ